MYFLGFSVDFLRRHANALVRFEPSRAWWNRYENETRLNWEYADPVPQLESLSKLTAEAKSRPGCMVPAMASALRLNEIDNERAVAQR